MSITAQGVLPSSDTFRLRNVETGLFLTDAGASAQPVTMTNLDEDDISTHWTFIESGAFYNIDNKDGSAGILRAPGMGGPGGPYVVLSTGTTTSSGDKIWTIEHNATDDTYRFQSGTSSRYMYHELDGTVTHIPVAATDDRSNWELVPYVQDEVEPAPDEDTNPDLSCPSSDEFRNATRTSSDLLNPVNVGTIDDRTCYADYSEFDLYGKTWGVYNITDGSNHLDTNGLQPRIERSLPRSQETGVGSYARFTGTFRILEVGETGNSNTEGTYIAQAKGKHDLNLEPGGSPDPAICLFLAKPVMGTGINAGKQVAFDIYAERITVRGGEGPDREEEFIVTVDKDEEIDFVLDVGFAEDPTDPTKKIHYCNASFNGIEENWNIPNPEAGLESGIRYGVYRVRGGRAQTRWANTTYQKVEVVDSGNAPDGIYRFKNLATGKYLRDAGDGSIIASDSGVGSDKEWQFVAVPGTSYYNIDSQGPRKIIRHTGAFQLVGTNISAPNGTNDKLWDVILNGDGSYSFEAIAKNGRLLYHDVDNSMVISTNTDDRSKWILESTTLSSSGPELKTSSIKIYPNPANDRFTIAFKNISNIEGVEIYSILGKRVYQNEFNGSDLVVESANFKAGVYLVKALADDNKVYHTKLVIE
ncbi:T9SS type A sorting domain-containing protein [Hyunsoonleella aquatilis]|nr:T9SS type A sorting domain-containing protein [Hyunsoonleella aquatilis]